MAVSFRRVALLATAFAVVASGAVIASIPNAHATRHVAPPEAKPAEAREAEAADITELALWRTQLGFSADRSFIRDLIEHPAQHRAVEAFGGRFTPIEWREVRERWMAQQYWDVVDSFIADRGLEDLSAGSWMDHSAGGTVNIAFTRDADRWVEELRASYPYPQRLRAVTAVHPLDELLHGQARLRAQQDELKSEGVEVVSSVVDEPGNTLVVRVVEIRNDTEQRVRAHVGAEVPVRVETGARFQEAIAGEDMVAVGTRSGTVEDPNRDTTTYGNPLRGGLSLRAWNSTTDNYHNTCTSGFVAQAADGTRWLTTAAHCFNLNQNVYQGWVSSGSSAEGWVYRKINPVTRRNHGGQSDIAAVQIPTTLSSRLVYVHPADYAHVISAMQSRSADVARSSTRAGDITCAAGQYNPGSAQAQNCGELLTRFLSYTSDGASFTNMRESTLDCRPGDSGAAVYSAYVANGLLAAMADRNGDGDGEDAGDSCAYSHIDRALEDIGLTSVVTS